MKFVQKLLMGIGGLAAAAALLTLVSPKAHAIAATLVEVTNTRSAPVPNQDVDAPARHPFAATCSFVNTIQGLSGCFLPAPPTNTELVIQTVYFFMDTGSSTTPAPLSVASLTLSTAGTGFVIQLPVVNAGGQLGTAIQSLTTYVDPGNDLFCSLHLGPMVPSSTEVTCTITGYKVSLP
jgi:hypothetical protein